MFQGYLTVVFQLICLRPKTSNVSMIVNWKSLYTIPLFCWRD